MQKGEWSIFVFSHKEQEMQEEEWSIGIVSDKEQEKQGSGFAQR